MTGAASDASGRPQLTITKDTTLRLSFGAFAAIAIYIGGASWWFSEIRQADREVVKVLDKELTRQIENLRVDATRKTDTLSSDLTYTSKTLTGYTNRIDRLDEGLRELSLVRHRLEKSEHSSKSQDRRMAVHEAKLEEAQRGIAELRIVNEYIMRWLNQPGTEPPKKRNELLPFKYGGDQLHAENPLAK